MLSILTHAELYIPVLSVENLDEKQCRSILRLVVPDVVLKAVVQGF
ncbi:MAG: hypothetical protein JRJ85_23615 [Deltaproteobacteria bacterium]|nr:hypothetical protein [Deltaproteobacteria bacterium]